jgi:VWFA-related protein
MVGRRLTRTCGLASWLLLLSTWSSAQQGAVPPRTPRFTSNVDVTSIDVTVVDDNGKPILDLKPSDFTVRIDNAPRRVVTAEWTPLVTETGPPAPPPPDGYSTNESTSGGRLILFVIDQPNIRFGASQSIQRTVGAFIDRLQPTDRIAAVGIGPGNLSTPFTADRERVKRAISRMTGMSRQLEVGDFNLSATEAAAIARGEFGALDRVMARECAAQLFPDPDTCRISLTAQAMEMAADPQLNGETTISTLRTLLYGLAVIETPKTVIFVSEGFPVEDRRPAVLELGALAGTARTSLYVLRLDRGLFDAAERSLVTMPAFDRYALNEGLDMLAAASRGTVFNVTGTGTNIFERIESELSGYYILGLESMPQDRDGGAHPIRVDVARRGATVRTRRIFKGQFDDVDRRTPRQTVAAALSAPLTLSSLPLKVAAFSLLGPERGRIQLLIHADIGAGYTESRMVTLAYTVADPDGRIVDSRMVDARLPPIMKGVPSPLQFVAGSSVPTGEYVVKVAASDGDRVGSIEHTFRAAVTEANGLTFSDLMVGGPIDARDLQQPTVSDLVSYGTVHGYIEVYGGAPDRLSTKFELAATPTSPTLTDLDVPANRVSETRVIFSNVMPTRLLPPGRYVLRAVVSDTTGSSPEVVRTLTRGFEVTAPPVLMTSAGGVGISSIPMSDFYLPVVDEMFLRPFVKSDVLKADLVKAFRDQTAPAAIPGFDEGVAALTNDEYDHAETVLKDAIKLDSESPALVAYLAAVFAASGHDREAAGAWQTALINGSDVSELYVWLGDALFRTHDLLQARTILQEAVTKWPDDPRFAKPLALTYATFGQGPEAVRMLERHLTAEPGDRGGLMLAVEWLYHLRVMGAVAHSRAEDQALARRYADAYLKLTKGKDSQEAKQVALVRQWVSFLERDQRPERR